MYNSSSTTSIRISSGQWSVHLRPKNCTTREYSSAGCESRRSATTTNICDLCHTHSHTHTVQYITSHNIT